MVWQPHPDGERDAAIPAPVPPPPPPSPEGPPSPASPAPPSFPVGGLGNVRNNGPATSLTVTVVTPPWIVRATGAPSMSTAVPLAGTATGVTLPGASLHNATTRSLAPTSSSACMLVKPTGREPVNERPRAAPVNVRTATIAGLSE